MKTLEEREEREHQREEIIKEATDAANRIILDGNDGSTEETNYLTARVAEDLTQTALWPFHAAMLHEDLKD